MERVVVGIDGSSASAGAARFAVDEARVRGWPVTAVLVESHPGRHGERSPADGEGRRRSRTTLDRVLHEALGDGAALVDQRVEEVELTATGLLHQVDAGDLLVVGAESQHLTHGLIRGSTTQQCLHLSPCPVAVVHDRSALATSAFDPRSVVVGLDGSAASRRALRWGIDEARTRDVPLEVVHAWQVPVVASYVPTDPRDPVHEQRARARLAELLDDLPPEAAPVELRTLLVEGPPSNVLLDRSDAGDLVVIGTSGVGAVAGLLLGSTALRISQTASHPIVFTPAPV